MFILTTKTCPNEKCNIIGMEEKVGQPVLIDLDDYRIVVIMVDRLGKVNRVFFMFSILIELFLKLEDLMAHRRS